MRACRAMRQIGARGGDGMLRRHGLQCAAAGVCVCLCPQGRLFTWLEADGAGGSEERVLCQIHRAAAAPGGAQPVHMTSPCVQLPREGMHAMGVQYVCSTLSPTHKHSPY